MAVRVGDAALVGEHRREAAGDVVGVGRLLRQPPRVFAAGAVVVVAVADPVHVGHVDAVAPHVFERAVGAAVPGSLRVPVELAAQELVLLAAGVDAIFTAALDGLILGLLKSHELFVLLARLVRHQLRLDRVAGQVEVADVDLIVDDLRRGVAAVGVVDDAQAAGAVRQEDGPAIEQAVGVVHLDRVGPLVAVEPAGEGDPVRTGVRAVAAPELLSVREPDAALAVDADLRVGVARPRLDLLAGVGRLAALAERRQLGDWLHQLAVFEADDLDRAVEVHRVGAVVEGAEVLAPAFGAFFVGDPEPAGGVVADGGAGMEARRCDRLPWLDAELVATLKVKVEGDPGLSVRA